MNRLRRLLSVWSVAWLTTQILTISTALLIYPREAAEGVICLRPGPAEECPMHGITGDACPMHDGSQHSGTRVQLCALSAPDATAFALAQLFSVPGILQDQPFVVRSDAGIAFPLPASRMPATAPATDSPPPRI